MPVRFQVDGDFYDHPKAIGLSDAAVALWVRAGSYCANKLSDGFVADQVLPTLSRSEPPAAAADELCRARLWRRVRGGYRFHQYEQRNLLRARVEAERTADRQRKRAQRRGETPNEAATKDHRGPIEDALSTPVDNRQGAAPGTPAATTPPQPNGQVVPADIRRDSHRTSDRSPSRFRSLSVSVSESVSVSGSGRAASPPPARCPTHLDTPAPGPCGPCADARRALEAWTLRDVERRRGAPQCPRHRGWPADSCGPCRSEALAGER